MQHYHAAVLDGTTGTGGSLRAKYTNMSPAGTVQEARHALYLWANRHRIAGWFVRGRPSNGYYTDDLADFEPGVWGERRYARVQSCREEACGTVTE